MERQERAVQAALAAGGASREEDRKVANMCVPIVVNKLIEHLQIRGCKEEGVLRLAASREESYRVKQQLCDGCQAPDLYGVGVHVIGDVLKHFVREVPNSLLDKSKWDRWMAIADLENADVRAKQCKALLLELDHTNRALVTVLFHLMTLIVQKAKYTKMDANNLARVMAPNLLRDDDPLKECSAMSKIILLVETMITHFGLVFREMGMQYRVVNTINHKKAAQGRSNGKSKSVMRSAPPPPPAQQKASVAPPLKKQKSEAVAYMALRSSKKDVPAMQRSKTESLIESENRSNAPTAIKLN